MTHTIDPSKIRSVIHNSDTVYHGTKFSVLQREVIAPNGEKISTEVINHPGAVVVLPILEQGEIVLIRNHRHPIDTTLWELPSGTLEQGEEPAEAAPRELLEETGYKGSNISPLLHFFSMPGLGNQILYAFVAKGLDYIGQKLDPGEVIDVEVHNWTQVEAMIRSGKICDAKTLVILLYYKMLLGSAN